MSIHFDVFLCIHSLSLPIRVPKVLPISSPEIIEKCEKKMATQRKSWISIELNSRSDFLLLKIPVISKNQMKNAKLCKKKYNSLTNSSSSSLLGGSTCLVFSKISLIRFLLEDLPINMSLARCFQRSSSPGKQPEYLSRVMLLDGSIISSVILSNISSLWALSVGVA